MEGFVLSMSLRHNDIVLGDVWGIVKRFSGMDLELEYHIECSMLQLE
jgi:hypothetical protein